MRKKTAILLSFLLGIMAIGTACEHTHVWDVEVVSEATCDQKGELLKTCSKCGEEEREWVSKLEHELETQAAQEPTCLNPGWESYEYCKNCDYTTKEELSALGHDFVDGVCKHCDEIKEVSQYELIVVCPLDSTTEQVLKEIIESYEEQNEYVKISLRTFDEEASEYYLLKIAQNLSPAPNILFSSNDFWAKWHEYFFDLRPYYEASEETDYSLFDVGALDAASLNGLFKPTKNYTNPLGAFARELDEGSDGYEDYNEHSEFGLYYADTGMSIEKDIRCGIFNLWDGKSLPSGININGEYKTYAELSWDFIKYILTKSF